MIARVSNIQLEPGKIDAFLDSARAARPQVEALPGYSDSRVLVDRKSGRVMVVQLYESEAGARAFESLTAVRERVSAAGGYSLGSVKTEYWEVAPLD
jgi:heme-degrading monooxygenase HmoA